MGNRLTPIRRITALYVVFFAVIILSIVLSFSSTAFREGFQTGQSDAVRMMSGGSEAGMNIIYDLRAVPENHEFSIPVYGKHGSGVQINGRSSVMDVEVVSQPGVKVKGLGIPTLFLILAAFMYLAVFVIIFMILTSLRSSIKQGGLMWKEVVPLTRSIGILLICASLSWSLSGYLESRAVAPYFEESGFEIITSFSVDGIQIIMGVLVFFIAEVFSIGYRLSEEQKLTI